MRCGCIAVGNVECDGCNRGIKHGERYLLVGAEGSERQRLCVDCCRSHDYVSYGTEKGKQVITFLPKE